MIARLTLPLLLVVFGLTSAHAANSWSRVVRPLASAPEAIGTYSAGCIAGAKTLNLIGDGYQVMRPGRNRYYGHPALIAFVEKLGRDTARRGGRLLIGDLSQPLGGPMASGHRSHQIGLDVDIWFLQQPRDHILSRQKTEQLPMLSMVQAGKGTLHPARWSSRYRDTLKQAAQSPNVARIFVNPIIKQALCRSERDRSWLHKLRPWRGHDAHFHVRLACPADSPQCKSQRPIPAGDGCIADLANWVEDIRQAVLSPKPRKKSKPPSTPRLPTACKVLLSTSMAQH